MTIPLATSLADRLCRPQKLGVFGHRGVGKTTLLTMLYREAAGGRLPGLRLAAGDARTATYLADKIKQLEAGERLPATLDETELRFHLYQEESRIELVVLDYQGEHVALGRQEPIRNFLRDCDAVWLCLDAPLSRGESRLQAEQEAEQIAEDYLATERAGEPHRPMALVVTKADLLENADDVDAVRTLVEQTLGMTRHTLSTHCPWQGVFAISSLGAPGQTGLHPAGLEGPLVWLVRSLREQDGARLEQLWRIAPTELGLLGQATGRFARRYPNDAATRDFQARLSRSRWTRRVRQVLSVSAAICALFALLWGYDALGTHRLERALSASGDDLVARRAAWRTYEAWYPTRYLFQSSRLATQRDEIAELDMQIRLAELRHRADNPDDDPEVVWSAFVQFREQFPSVELTEVDLALRTRLKKANDARRAEREKREKADRDHKGRLAFRELEQAEITSALPVLIELASRLAREHAEAEIAPEILRRRAVYLRRLDERDFEEARDYSRRNPTNFYTRRQKYQQYLDRHPEGAFASVSREALKTIASEWDRHDYRVVHDLHASNPADWKDLRTHSRNYLSAHPDGKYRNSVSELMRFCDMVSEPGEYKITLKSGSFSKKIAHLISRGAYLSVEIEVAGVRYGPSTIVKRSYQPEWDYEFPRKVRWKRGDPVRIIVTDNYFWKRRMGDVTFDDPLALGKLGADVEVPYGTLTFVSDFRIPRLPKVE
jgi:hypothetical protein